MTVPDFRYINRNIQIREVARALDLRFGTNGNIHCWRPERHQHDDRTASVGIRKTNNSVKCFGCDLGPLGCVDLVKSVLELKSPSEAGEWIAQHFSVPRIRAGKHLAHPERRDFQVGLEDPIGLLIRSGLWAILSSSARAILPVMLEFADREDAGKGALTLKMSYRALERYGGIASPNAVANAIRQLEEIGWLYRCPGAPEPGAGPTRTVSHFVITPKSDEIMELANFHRAQMRAEIEAERDLRLRAKRKRTALLIK